MDCETRTRKFECPMKKILHITTDNKFISHALTTFENVYPGQNTVWMFANGHDGHVTKNHQA